MKGEVRLWKTEAKSVIPKLNPLADSNLFRLNAVFYYDFFFKNGKVRKFDTHNLMKVLQDAVAEKNGFEDSLIKFNMIESYHSPDKEYVECELQQVTNE